MKLTREQRDNRDQISADAEIRMAENGKVAGIVVDDARAMQRMLKRVRDIAQSRGLNCMVTTGRFIEVFIGAGSVRIVPADALGPKA